MSTEVTVARCCAVPKRSNAASWNADLLLRGANGRARNLHALGSTARLELVGVSCTVGLHGVYLGALAYLESSIPRCWRVTHVEWLLELPVAF